jgi:hypothetical protein
MDAFLNGCLRLRVHKKQNCIIRAFEARRSIWPIELRKPDAQFTLAPVTIDGLLNPACSEMRSRLYKAHHGSFGAEKGHGRRGKENMGGTHACALCAGLCCILNVVI